MKKNFTVAVVLVLFFGPLCVHNFYLGFKTPAIWQLILSLVGIPLCFLAVGFFIIGAVGIWVFIEFIQILCKSGKYSTVDWE